MCVCVFLREEGKKEGREGSIVVEMLIFKPIKSSYPRFPEDGNDVTLQTLLSLRGILVWWPAPAP